MTTKTSHGLDELAEIAFVDPKQVYIKPDLLATLNIASLVDSKYPVGVNNYL